MVNIPLVRVRYADSFARVLNQLGAPTEKVLNRAGFSLETLSVPDGFMPVRQLWELTESAAEYTGLFDIGLKAGLTPLEQHSQFGNMIMHSPTLYQALSVFCDTARAELTDAAFHLKQQNGMAWFCIGAVEGSSTQVQQVELYRLGMAIQVVRAALGEGWQPAELKLQSDNERSLQGNELISKANVRFACYEGALGIPRHALSLRLKGGGDLVFAPTHGAIPHASLNDDLTLANSIREIIRTQISSRQLGIEKMARAIGMPLRTMQRRLAENGLIYSKLVEEFRIETASKMLKNSDAQIIEIAMETGYQEHTHFTRAFRRVTGLAPRQYRAFHRSVQ